MNALTEQM